MNTRHKDDLAAHKTRLLLHNKEGQPVTFAGVGGELNVDFMLFIRSMKMQDWRLLDSASMSAHRLIIYRISGAREPSRVRNRRTSLPISGIMGLTYRAASRRCKARSNVVNSLALADGVSADMGGTMAGMLCALCPDKDPGWDTDYHRLIRVTTAPVLSGKDAMLMNCVELGRIVGSLPNTAPCLDGISSRIVQHIFKAAQSEFVRIYEKCVREGVFPRMWKSGRPLIIPKNNASR
ncbi:hypothetical protein EVAR_57640_1 [Eumeta japonica]|uniref:115 kDa protein in type-1 retrotransposable element R1DM n=1 Tax=Eumeta variegata TaxID=151549 RepID=A0A4C1ZL70_EUMVA|nr:hypothetical protein EVAR_57640_1 [Eumeta japonica]